MDQNVRQMIAAARTLLEVAETLMEPMPSVVAPSELPPASEQRAKPPTKREPGRKRMGRPPMPKHFECVACHRKFESTSSLLDANCPDCNSTNIIRAPQARQI